MELKELISKIDSRQNDRLARIYYSIICGSSERNCIGYIDSTLVRLNFDFDTGRLFAEAYDQECSGDKGFLARHGDKSNEILPVAMNWIQRHFGADSAYEDPAYYDEARYQEFKQDVLDCVLLEIRRREEIDYFIDQI